MTGQDLKKLEDKLWEAADQLRANSKLTATEYSFPVLGLIFLRHAWNRFGEASAKIEANLTVHPQRGRRPVNKDDFQEAKAIFLPAISRWNYIATLPESEDIGEKLDEAMRAIEQEYEVLSGVLPKSYSMFEKALLQRLIRIFNTEELNNVSGDVFGRIYEYFLNKFAMSGAQEGGEFFTPPSLVNCIVNIIEPTHGTVFDPACGSFGMAVQTGHFLEEMGLNPSEKVTFYGQEKTDTNTKLAKMNMTVHGLDCSILQGNSFYDDHHNLTGKCDYVMANPPFNVDGVDKSRDSVKNDARLPFGLPKNDNANYLWIQYFYAYLNPTGRAGFVMASSASDAGHTEKAIREQLVKTGAVDVMVSIGTKFFYTRSLPCTLWFYDRAKEGLPPAPSAGGGVRLQRSKETVLMLDLRDVYRKVSSNLHDFTPEQLRNIQAVVSLYRGDSSRYHSALNDYAAQAHAAMEALQVNYAQLQALAVMDPLLDLTHVGLSWQPEHLKKQKRELLLASKHYQQAIKDLLKQDEVRKDKTQREALQKNAALADTLTNTLGEAAETTLYYQREIHWLSSRFPDGEYRDVPGLCRLVTQAEIADNDYSLTAGRYVGVASQLDDGFDYEERMGEIKIELQGLNAEAVTLANTIQEHLNELGL